MIAVALALCVAGAIAVVMTGGPVATTLDVPRIAELPGGFDPLPEFDTTSGELAFRGVECRVAANDRYALHRPCPSHTEQQ